MSNLLIHKIGNSFFHVDSLLTEFPMFLGDFWADIENDKFQLNRYAGSSGHEYNFTDVTIQVDSGSIKNFTAREDLTNRLKEISYPGIKNFSSGGSTPTPYRKVFTFSGGAQTFTLDSGVVAKSVFLNKAVLYNDSTSIQEWSQAGDIVTINDSLNTLEIDDQIYILN